MKEPLRLMHDPECPAALREALAASEAAPPALPAAIHATLSTVATKLGATALTSTTAGAGAGVTVASSAGAGLPAAIKLIGVVACLGGAGTVAYVAEPLIVPTSTARNRQLVSSAPVATSASGRPSAGQGQPSSASALGADVRRGEPTSELARVAAPAAEFTVADPSPPRSQDASTEVGGIAAEARLLERARRHLSSDPALSLRETKLHSERFASGKMAEERELIAVEALLRLGRRSEVERRAAPQLQQDRAGLYTKRLRQLLDEF
ncbi:MAG TPA: hypothetical protein VIV60_26670 [Polyangiaceae bacterium]